MESTLNLCRLCFVKAEEGINIFKKPRGKFHIANEFMDLLQISLEQKDEWPSGACKKCVDFIAEIKSFREKVLATQEILVNVTPETESLPPLDDDYFRDDFSSDETVEDKTEIKTELPMEPQVVIEPLPKLPSRRTTRVSKRPEIPEDTVTTFDNSSDEEELLPPPLKKLRSKIEEQDEADYSAATYQAKAKKPKKPKKKETPPASEQQPPKKKKKNWRRANASTMEGLDFLVRRQTLLEDRERRSKWSFEQKEESRMQSLKLWEKKFKEKYTHLTPIIEELKLRVCDICKVEQESLGSLFCHQEREHDISRNAAYVNCCETRYTNSLVLGHCMYHLDKDTFKCPIVDCGKQCTSKARLSKHTKMKHTEGKFKCTKCTRAFMDSGSLEKHEYKHLVYRFTCQECVAMFESQEKLDDHINFIHMKMPRVICDVCGKGYNSYSGLTSHQKVHSGDISSVNMGQCDVCGLYFKDVPTHKKNAHTKVLVNCPECGKQFSKNYIKSHLKVVHAKSSDFECTVCQRPFTSKDKLKAHMDIHLGIRYPCHFCPEHYGSTSNRQKHLHAKHPHEWSDFLREKNAAKMAKYIGTTAAELLAAAKDPNGED